MSRHFWHSVVSILIVIGLIVPITFESQAPAIKAAPISEPNPPSSKIETSAAPTSAVRSTGRLFFAPSIDADGDPATNPIESAPVPVIRIGEAASGIVQLAAQVTLDDQTRAPGNVPVTFRVWAATGTIFQQTVRTDSWGAAEVDVPRLKVDDVYAYQASAPSFDLTEVRRFHFDAQQASYALHWSGAQLTVTQTTAGQFELVLHSPVALDATKDHATVLIARRIAMTGTLTNELITASLPRADRTYAYWPFPKVELHIVGEYTATLQTQVPPGDYHFVAALQVERDHMDQFYSQPVAVIVNAGPSGAVDRSAAEWVSPLEFETDRVLVRYRATDDRAVFDLVPTEAAPTVEPELPEQSVWTKQYRTGPFEWQTERQLVRVDTRVDDGKKNVSVQALDYDPLAQRYQIAIKPKGDETITDTLRVSALGPGGVVLQHEVISVTLKPHVVTYHTVEVPADKGKPIRLVISLDDPFEKLFNDIGWALNQIGRIVKKYGTVRGYLTLSADAIQIVLVQFELFVPELVGAGLAVIGVAVQAMVRNPLADPYIFGVESGAAAGAVAVIFFGGVLGTSLLTPALGGFVGRDVAEGVRTDRALRRPPMRPRSTSI